MISATTVKNINEIRSVLLEAVKILPEVSSFRFLLETSLFARADLDEIINRANALPGPCQGKFTCAVIGSSGHGKTALLAEIFPAIAERGWLAGGSAALAVSHAPRNSPELDEITVNSRDVAQLKALMQHPEVEERNARDKIEITYPEDGVDVDGSKAEFPDADPREFRFPKQLELRPFSQPCQIPPEKSREFARALNVKEASAAMHGEPLITQDGRAYNALLLRAVVKDICLRDAFARITKTGGLPEEQAAALTFIDIPGLTADGDAEDEVLRHCLGKKSEQTLLDLWENGGPDIAVHIVRCGEQSDFARLWKAVERKYGPTAMESLCERLILAVNGANAYFTAEASQNLLATQQHKDADKNTGTDDEDPRPAEDEGTEQPTKKTFNVVVDENILEKMSPHGRVKPARICFVDAKSSVEKQSGVSYAEAYRTLSPVLEKWLSDSSDLSGLLKEQENIEALADPEDRGQIFLLRQILELAEEKGAAILACKYLPGLIAALTDLLDLLVVCYERDGAINQGAEAVQRAVRGCLSDPEDPQCMEDFATETLDPDIEQIADRYDRRNLSETWAAESFRQMCSLVKKAIIKHSRLPEAAAKEFTQYFEHQEPLWAERWGYIAARLGRPNKGFSNSGELVTHCLKLHCREIFHFFYQAPLESQADNDDFEQSAEDRQQVCQIMENLKESRKMGIALEDRHGVGSYRRTK
ncbi:MAG: hypothetical protein GY862_27340 [Gammaproteobacteria bacterium]|nr:hypothetical protein [Gammaproteobacteria bacterium]